MRLRRAGLPARMVVVCGATMQLLHGNKRIAVMRGGESGGVEHAGEAPRGEQYNQNKPKEPAPSQVAVMFDPSAHTAIQLRTVTCVLDVDQVVRISARSSSPRRTVGSKRCCQRVSCRQGSTSSGDSCAQGDAGACVSPSVGMCMVEAASAAKVQS
jgi:hypothetical protein